MKFIATVSVTIFTLLLISTPVLPCSVFAAYDGTEVFAGNNEDYYGGTDTVLWFVPPEDGKYGFVMWGYTDALQQGGMNDQGLFWDGLATPSLPIENCTGKLPFTSTTTVEMMQESATVDEAIAFLEEYDYTDVLEVAQLMFADANGDFAIFEGDETIYPKENYQIALNFYWSNPSLGNYPDWRLTVLEEMMTDGLEVTSDYFIEMADGAHQGSEPGPGVYTRYTTICDLTRGQFYLYYDLDFENYILFDLEKELEQESYLYMSELFNPEDEPDAGADSDADTDTDSDTDTDADDDGGPGEGADDGDGDCGCKSAGRSGVSPLFGLLFRFFS